MIVQGEPASKCSQQCKNLAKSSFSAPVSAGFVAKLLLSCWPALQRPPPNILI